MMLSRARADELASVIARSIDKPSTAAPSSAEDIEAAAKLRSELVALVQAAKRRAREAEERSSGSTAPVTDSSGVQCSASIAAVGTNTADDEETGEAAPCSTSSAVAESTADVAAQTDTGSSGDPVPPQVEVTAPEEEEAVDGRVVATREQSSSPSAREVELMSELMLAQTKQAQLEARVIELEGAVSKRLAVADKASELAAQDATDGDSALRDALQAAELRVLELEHDVARGENERSQLQEANRALTTSLSTVRRQAEAAFAEKAAAVAAQSTAEKQSAELREMHDETKTELAALRESQSVSEYISGTRGANTGDSSSLAYQRLHSRWQSLRNELDAIREAIGKAETEQIGKRAVGPPLAERIAALGKRGSATSGS